MARSNKIDVEASLVKARLLGGIWTSFLPGQLQAILEVAHARNLEFHPDWQEILVYESPTDS